MGCRRHCQKLLITTLWPIFLVLTETVGSYLTRCDAEWYPTQKQVFFVHCVKGIRNQIQQHPADILRE